jgi:hypothetical protein
VNVEETSCWHMAKIPYLIFRKSEDNVAKLPMTTFSGLSTVFVIFLLSQLLPP